MSADRQRLKSAIQRIAKEDPEIRGLLGEGQNRGGKASSAGVGTSDAERDRLCCDGSTSDSANPGTSERDPDADDAGQGGLDPDDPANLSSGDGTLSGVVDCATGESICFDGSGFIPPDGWDSPTDPPIDPDFVPGCRWYHTSLGASVNFALPDDSYYAVHDEDYCQKRKDSDSRCAGYHYAWRRANNFGDCLLTSGASYSVYGETPEDEIPLAKSWPADSCVNLAIKNGTIVGSKYDPENDGSYSAPRDSIDLCDGNGNQISLAPASNGGWKTINSTNDNGYLYDSSGKQIAHIDGNEYSDPSV